MSWDQPVHSFSYPNGEPQTPTRTPTATVFGDSAFQTPKLESSFYDPRVTWDTSDPYASSPEFLRTPHKFALGTPLRLPDIGREQNAGDTSLKSVKAESEQTSSKKRTLRPKRSDIIPGDDGSHTENSSQSAASMQTPPPSSASTRKVTGLAQVQSAARRLSTPCEPPETPSRVMGASPRMIGNLQSSPDLFQLPPVDSSTIPSFFPQHRLFWDEGIGQHLEGAGLPGTDADPFDSSSANAFASNHGPGSISQIPPLPTIDGSFHGLPELHNNNDLGLGSATSAEAGFFPAPFSTSPRLPMARLVEDPAMFLSSPARRFGGPQPSPVKNLFSRETRQPYHHQTEEFKREELRRAQSKNPQSSESSLSLADEDDDDDDDIFSPRKLRPGLARSATNSSISLGVSGRSQLHQPLPSSAMASSCGIRKSPSKGRSSPAKSLRNRQFSPSHTMAAGIPTQSQSLVLKIGKDGRAKTEMQVVTEPPMLGLTDSMMAAEISSTTTEDDSDWPGNSDYALFRNRQAPLDASRTVFERSESGSRPHSKSSSYSSSTIHSGRLSPWSLGENRRPQYRHVSEGWKRTPIKRISLLGNPSLTHGSPSTINEPDDEDTGDAQHALRQVLKGRSRSVKHHTVSGYKPRANRRSLGAAHLRSSPPPRFGGEVDYRSRISNASPATVTDPDLSTPTTNRHSNPSNATRCICNSMDNGGHLMIQCESCSHWLHTKCVGLERSNLPSVYVCMFCEQTPTRKPVRNTLGGNQGLLSPLAHKSTRYR
ncbi:hypothetical protein MAP00_002858 [Monascus purpureus]|nr:hypothetical protein MAP00_002858 [Monascus purpureus]